MKQPIVNLLLLLPLLLMVGCSNEDDTGTQLEVRPGDEVQFNIGFAPSTRASTDVAFNTVFEDGDEIGVFAFEEGTTDVVAQNVKLVRINGNWTAATDADKIYYPLNGKRLDFYAYYPYQGDYATTWDNLSFEVQADQSSASSYSKSDLLTATVGLQNNNLVTLTFDHLMAMIQVTVDRVAPVPAFREGTDGFKVVLKNVKRETDNLNWVTNAANVDTSTPATDITMYRVPTTDGSWIFRALIPSQQLATGELFRFSQALQGNVIDMGYSISAPLTPATAKASTYKVTLDYQLDPTHVYNVGDVYPYKGTSVGIVFYTENNGKNGKVVSLDERTAIRWADAIYTLPVTDVGNGRKNMQTIANYIAANNKSWSNFPAFEWIHGKNATNTDYSNNNATGVWYMPAVSELQYFYCAINDKTPEIWNYLSDPSWGYGQNTAAIEAFNQKLISSDGEKLSYTSQSNPYYMSSSANVSTSNRFEYIFFESGWRGSIQMNYNDGGFVRAIMTF